MLVVLIKPERGLKVVKLRDEVVKVVISRGTVQIRLHGHVSSTLCVIVLVSASGKWPTRISTGSVDF